MIKLYGSRAVELAPEKIYPAVHFNFWRENLSMPKAL